ncbi:protein kinase domain-containing protein [Nonomuraea insulae]|uniref:non-specific serine/threonine protein kinase n=1 Tax=Nonomuraea insulae TaxID=1616787 RepID=A0ABW1CKY7_9ACTN
MPQAEPLREGDPSAVGPYRLLGRLGAGGQGVVYLGQRSDFGPVAVKVFRDGRADERFAKEIEAARRVEPFCIAQVLDASVSGRPYIVTEYVEGPSLQQAGRHAGADLQRLAVATATALAAIHQAGIVHRDFKPANVLLGQGGPRVIDFGIARSADAGPSGASGIMGTPAYMAPEQLAGAPVGPAVDVFAWGSVMAFAATGSPPFGEDTLPAVINRILHNEPQLGDLPQPLRTVVLHCLAKEPANRPSMQDVLLRLLGGPQQAGHPASGYGGPQQSGHPAAAHGGQDFGQAPHASHSEPSGYGGQPSPSAASGYGGQPPPLGPSSYGGQAPHSSHPGPSGYGGQRSHSGAPGYGGGAGSWHGHDGPPTAPRHGAGRGGAGRTWLVAGVASAVTLVVASGVAWGVSNVWGSQAPAPSSQSLVVTTTKEPSPTPTRKRAKRTRTPSPTPSRKQTTRPPEEPTASPKKEPTTAAPKRTVKPTRTASSGGGTLRIVSLRAQGARKANTEDCQIGMSNIFGLVEGTKLRTTFNYEWILDGKVVERSQSVIAESHTQQVVGPLVKPNGSHRVTLRLTSPSTVSRTLAFRICPVGTE